MQNPLLGDNNNGITVIDFEDPKNISYCFVSIHHLECLRDDVVDPEDYVEGEGKTTYRNLTPMSAEEYLLLHYSREKLEQLAESDPTGTTGRALSNLYKLRNVKVMTEERLNELFDWPRLQAKEREYRRKQEAKWEAQRKKFLAKQARKAGAK